MAAGEVHRSIVAQRVEPLRNVRAANTAMTVHDDFTIGWNFSEAILNFVHRNIHGTGDTGGVDELVGFPYVQQERRGVAIETLRQPVGRYRLHL